MSEIRALATAINDVPRAAHRTLADAYVLGLGKALGKATAKDGKILATAGTAFAEGFLKGLGTATAFIFIFLVLYFAFRDVATRFFRAALGIRGISAVLADDPVPSR